MQEVKSVISLYVPPNPQKNAAGLCRPTTFRLCPAAASSQLVFKNYAQPGDQMTIAFDMAAKKIQTLNVNTYMGQAKDVVTLGRAVRQLA